MSDRVLEEAGYALVDEFMKPDRCETLLSQIGQYRKTNELAEIYRPAKGRSLRYLVIDGTEIRQHLPEIWALYHGPVKELINDLTGSSLDTLDNVRAGVNVNIMPPGRSEYRWHYDRTAATAILYLNQVEAGETELYPNYRILLNGRQHSRIQRFFDGCLRPSMVRKIFGNKMVVEPHPGRLMAMKGNRCWHSVKGVEGATERINVILAYDTPGARFPTEEGLDSYLYTQEESGPEDPNYTA